MRRALVPLHISRLLGGRPVRWASGGRNIGDFDGRDRALEVFNADPGEQRALLDAIDAGRAPLEAATGGPLVVIFHSVKQSRLRHGEFVDAFLRRAPRERVAPPDVVLAPERCVDVADESGPHRVAASAA
jgi:hypothetical protein